MLTFDAVFEIFRPYLEADPACELVHTRHGWAVMLWDNTGKEWTDVCCCGTPEALFDKLLESALLFQTYILLVASGADTLTTQEQAQVEAAKRSYLERRKEFQ